VSTKQLVVPESHSGLESPDRALAVQELYEEAESLRRILQAQTAVVLLLGTGSGRNAEPLLQTILQVGGWISTLDASLRNQARTNTCAAQLVTVLALVKASHADLQSIASPSLKSKDFRESIRNAHNGLAIINKQVDAIFAGTLVEMRSFKSGCACETDRLAEMRNI
jgi:hypothetical protein